MSSIQKEFEDNCLYVTSENEIPQALNYTNVIFENSQLKNEFFESLKLRDYNHTVINCLSSLEIFENALYNAEGVVMFDNVCCCRNNEILEKVVEYKKRKMLLC
jgi:hypothetical protein